VLWEHGGSGAGQAVRQYCRGSRWLCGVLRVWGSHAHEVCPVRSTCTSRGNTNLLTVALVCAPRWAIAVPRLSLGSPTPFVGLASLLTPAIFKITAFLDHPTLKPGPPRCFIQHSPPPLPLRLHKWPSTPLTPVPCPGAILTAVSFPHHS